MTLFPFLPFCRQSMPAKRKLLDDIRSLIRLTRHSQDGLPRIRIRSLDVIPLSLSLHRHSSVQSITQHIDPHASTDNWLTLQPGSHFATHIVTSLCAFYSASSSSPVPRLPSLMTWNPSSLKTIHTQTSPKLSHILKLSRTHICFLQETQWTSLQYNHLHLQAPFCTVLHAPCIDQHSSGVATFLPRPFSSISHSIIEAGFILSVVTTISGVSCELINVYLHPDKVVLLGQKLLDHLLTPHSRQHPIRIVGGDFNHLQSKSPSLFTSLLQELNCPTPSPIPSFRKPDGYSSSLDFFLTQLPSHTHHLYKSKAFSYWPSYQPTGHGIHICKFITVPPVTRSDDDLPAQAIPSSVFYQPPSQLVRSSSPLSSPSLQPLIRSLLSLSSPSLLPVKTTIWARWRNKKIPSTNRPSEHHHHTLLKLLSAPKSTLLPVPVGPWHWLLSHFPDFEPPALSLIHDTHVLLPIHLLSTLITRYDILNSHRPPNRGSTQFTFPPTHTWYKCRFAAPKIAQHHGAIRSSSGEICTSTKTLDQALRATRSFWSNPPSPITPIGMHYLVIILNPPPASPPAFHLPTVTFTIPPLLLLTLHRERMVSLTLPGEFAPLCLLTVCVNISRILSLLEPLLHSSL